jgi:hypothetical protein
MQSTQISHHINLVKKDNVRWLRYANALIEGESLGKDAIPKMLDECPACQWLSDHSEELLYQKKRLDQDEIDLFHFDMIEQIFILRYELLEYYLTIFKTCLPEFNHSLFSNFFRSEIECSVSEKAKAKQTFLKMQRLVTEINQKLRFLEGSLLESCQLNIA